MWSVWYAANNNLVVSKNSAKTYILVLLSFLEFLLSSMQEIIPVVVTAIPSLVSEIWNAIKPHLPFLQSLLVYPCYIP